jgi:23S rRNA (uridine2552-2'-O)-methyltransferase
MKIIRQNKNRWEDHYTRKARQDHYPARSVYKLKEIQQKYNILKKGERVLDLGCAPGSWLIFASGQVGEQGRVVGIDKKPVTVGLPTNVTVHTADIFEVEDDVLTLNGKRFHVVISDMAPSTTGNKHVDCARSFQLCEAALAIAEKALVPGGAFICKIFQGEDSPRFASLVKAAYSTSKNYRPQSSRKASREIYIIGMGKKTENLSDEKEFLKPGGHHVGS